MAGPPGSGKTILAQQMCFANATAERKCVYYTTVSEPHTKLVRHLGRSPSSTRRHSGRESSTSTWVISCVLNARTGSSS